MRRRLATDVQAGGLDGLARVAGLSELSWAGSVSWAGWAHWASYMAALAGLGWLGWLGWLRWLPVWKGRLSFLSAGWRLDFDLNWELRSFSLRNQLWAEIATEFVEELVITTR